MRKLFIAHFIFILLPLFSYSFPENRKKVTALRIETPLKLDGKLDESCYQQAEPATNFVQLNPLNGKPANKDSEVKLFYDDNALYVGAMLYENPDSIQSYVTTRDEIGASDYFLIALDPYNEGLIMYEFLVTPAGSQTDLKAVKGEHDREDGSWDAVWQCKTRIVDNGWIAEMRIPYSALRFPNKDVHVWGLNFFRRLRRFNSNTSWQLVDQKVSGFIQQSGELHGINNINTPVRLSFSPYVAGYLQKNSNSEVKPILKGGLDMKLGIGDGHTLDMMLVPDFGQIQSDDEELNLSPYEIHYDERRQFFTEGVELFNRADIFYSRRIGSAPRYSDKPYDDLNKDEEVTFNPTETQLINATKLSGRNKNGWGIGFLNAMSLSSKATVKNNTTGNERDILTQPFTNYNVMVVEKSLKNNSLISLINTNLLLSGSNDFANVTGTEFHLKNNKETYQLNGTAAFSYRKFGEAEKGYTYEIGLQKIKGHLRFGLEREVISNTYNPNDMGFLRHNNAVEHDANVSYNIFDPFWIFKRWESTLFYENNRLYQPNNKIGSEIGLWTDGTFKNDWWYGWYIGYHFDKNDYFETRVNNRYWTEPGGNFSEFNLRTNQNKPLSFSGSLGLFQRSEKNMKGYWSHGGIWWKASPRFSLNFDFSKDHHQNNKGHVYHSNDDEEIIFGNYDRKTWENSFRLNYAFSTKLSTSIRARHYLSIADYDEYYDLQTNGTLQINNNWNDNSDVSFNAFNIDAALKWEFAPGSELSLVWKNEIYRDSDQIDLSYTENLKETLESSQRNSISLKVLYYIDYNYFKNK